MPSFDERHGHVEGEAGRNRLIRDVLDAANILDTRQTNDAAHEMMRRIILQAPKPTVSCRTRRI